MSPSNEIKKGLIRVEEKDGRVVWYHVCPRGTTTLFRKLSSLPAFEIVDSVSFADVAKTCESLVSFEISEIKAKTGLPVDTYKVEDPAAWALAASRLEIAEDLMPRTVVPGTPIRGLYDLLRPLPLELHVAFAEGFAARPEALATLCIRSQKAFQRFTSNCLLTPPRRNPLVGEFPFTSGNDVVAALLRLAETSSGVVAVSNNTSLNFRIVEREIDPRRTQKGFYQDGQSAKSSGIGGIDLILQSVENDLPIIGEIKFAEDSSAFLALIQSLAYLVELSTESQRRRLIESFDLFKPLVGRADFQFDLYVISSYAPTDGLRPEIYKLTKRLAQGLQGTEMGILLRRMAFLDVTSSDSGITSVHELFSVPVR